MRNPPAWVAVVVVGPIWAIAGAVVTGSRDRALAAAAALSALVVLFVGMAWALGPPPPPDRRS